MKKIKVIMTKTFTEQKSGSARKSFTAGKKQTLSEVDAERMIRLGQAKLDKSFGDGKPTSEGK